MPHQLDLLTIRNRWLTNALAAFPALELPDVFTSDDLHAVLPPPAHPNHFGVLCSNLERKGAITYVKHVQSKRKEANGRKISAWMKQS
jgi:hypothetical protein